MKCPKCGKGKVKAATTVVTVTDVSEVVLAGSKQTPGYRVNVVNDSECVEEEGRTLFCEACGYHWTSKELFKATQKLTPKAVKQYIKDPHTCPFCGEMAVTNIEPKEVVLYRMGSCEVFTHCKACKRAWIECYKLATIQESVA